MSATALLKFTQGPNTANAGVAVRGTLVSVDGPVTITNGDNTDVVAWEIHLLDAPPDSSTYALGAQPQLLASASNNSPVAAISPDVPGTYRVLLDVLDAQGNRDRDIRCFGVPDGNGYVPPGYQKNPDPLPLSAPPSIVVMASPPEKPDEQNYEEQPRGWAGSGDADDGQLAAFLKTYRDAKFRLVDATPVSVDANTPEFVLVQTSAIGAACTLNIASTVRSGTRFMVVDLEGSSPSNPITVNLPVGHTLLTGASAVVVNLSFAWVRLVYLGDSLWLRSDLFNAHAPTHLDGGSDPIDADRLEVSFVPSNYTRTTAPVEVDQLDQLTAHLAGIDSAIGSTGLNIVVWDPDVSPDTSRRKASFSACVAALLAQDGYGYVILSEADENPNPYEISDTGAIDLEGRVGVLNARFDRTITVTSSTGFILDPWEVRSIGANLTFQRDTGTDTQAVIEAFGNAVTTSNDVLRLENVSGSITATGEAPFLSVDSVTSGRLVLVDCQLGTKSLFVGSQQDALEVRFVGDRTTVPSDLFVGGSGVGNGDLQIKIEGGFDWTEALVGASWLGGTASFLRRTDVWPSGTAALEFIANDGTTVLSAVRHDSGSDAVLHNEVPLTAAGAGANALFDDGTYKPVTISVDVDAKESVRALSTAADGNITLSGLARVLDGFAANADGMRVATKHQTNPAENGIWVVRAAAWERPTDFDTGNGAAGSFFFVEQGTLYADTGWLCTTDQPSDIIDTDALAFVQVAGVGAVVLQNIGGGAGIFSVQTGNTYQLRSLVGFGGIVCSVVGDTVRVDGSAFIQALANVGGGAEVHRDTVTQTANLRTFVGSDGIDVVQETNSIRVQSSRDPITPPEITADQDDYNPTDWDTSDFVEVTLDAVHTITGFLAPTAAGTRLKVVKVGAASSAGVLVANDGTSSLSSSRVRNPGNVDLSLSPGDSMILLHYTQWHVVGVAKSTAEDVGVTSVSGLFSVVNPFFPTDNPGPALALGDDAQTAQRLVFLNSFRRWVRIGWSGDGTGSGFLEAIVLNDDGAVLGAGAWSPFIEVTDLIGVEGKIFAVAVPQAGGTRCVVAFTRIVPTSTLFGRFSDDGGATWSSCANNTPEYPSQVQCALHSGAGGNLIFGWNTGELEWSADGGVTWNVATPPNASPRRLHAIDEAGKVLIFQGGTSNEEYAYSSDHGQTWTEELLPALGASQIVRGVSYVNGVFVVLADDDPSGDTLVSTSTDGTTWSAWVPVTFTGPSASVIANLHILRNDDTISPVVALGAVLVGKFTAGASQTGDDLYYSVDNGLTWIPTGQGIMGSSDGATSQHIAVGGGRVGVIAIAGVAWFSLVDVGNSFISVAQQALTDTAPTAVGGAGSAGVSTSAGRADRHRDIGRLGDNIVAASTIDLNVATGDFVTITGTTPITLVQLSAGLRREIRAGSPGVRFETGANIVSSAGGSVLHLHQGDMVEVRAFADNQVWLFLLSRIHFAEGVPSTPLLRFASNRATDLGATAGGEVRFNDTNPQIATQLAISDSNLIGTLVAGVVQQFPSGSLLIYCTNVAWVAYSYTSITDEVGYTRFNGLTFLDGEGINTHWDDRAPDGTPLNVVPWGTASVLSDTAPSAVGGVGSAGTSEEVGRSDRGRDIGRLGTPVASASTIDLNAATGDAFTITGTTPIDTVLLATGLRREARAGSSGLRFIPSSSLVTSTGGILHLHQGDWVLIRAFATNQVWVLLLSRVAVAEGIPSTPALRFQHNRSITLTSTASGEVRFNAANPQASTQLSISDNNERGTNVAGLVQQFSAGTVLIYATNITWLLASYTSITDEGIYTTFNGLTILDGEGVQVHWDDGVPNGTPVNITLWPQALEAADATDQLIGTEASKASTPDSVAALWESGGTISGGGTITFGNGGSFRLISSTADITLFAFTNPKIGRRVTCIAETVRDIVYTGGGVLDVPTSANITTQIGDRFEVECRGVSGESRLNWYTRADGTPLFSGGDTFQRLLVFAFDTGTGGTDPGNGNFAYDNADITQDGEFVFDDLNSNGFNVAGFMPTAGGLLWVHNDDWTVWRVYTINDVTDETGFTRVAVEHLRGTGTFSVGPEFYLEIDQMGAEVATVYEGYEAMTGSPVTLVSLAESAFPGGGALADEEKIIFHLEVHAAGTGQFACQHFWFAVQKFDSESTYVLGVVRLGASGYHLREIATESEGVVVKEVSANGTVADVGPIQLIPYSGGSTGTESNVDLGVDPDVTVEISGGNTLLVRANDSDTSSNWAYAHLKPFVRINPNTHTVQRFPTAERRTTTTYSP